MEITRKFFDLGPTGDADWNHFNSFKSTEEWMFWQWLYEAQEYNFISDFEVQTPTFIITEPALYKIKTVKKLKTKTNIKTETRTLLRGKTYTPDFHLELNEKFWKLDHGFYRCPTHMGRGCFVDVKGQYTREHSIAEVFSLKQSIIFRLYGIYVQKLIIPTSTNKLKKKKTFFQLTWVPEIIANKTIKGKLVRREPYKDCRLVWEVNDEIEKEEYTDE